MSHPSHLHGADDIPMERGGVFQQREEAQQDERLAARRRQNLWFMVIVSLGLWAMIVGGLIWVFNH